MAPAKTDQVKTAERASRKAKAEARRQRAAEELRLRRGQQFQAAQAALDKLEESLRTARDKASSHQTLSDHLTGFYDEIDKLAKGRALLEVTDLVVQQANDIIRDAKGIIQGDTYLDRIKEFVPAGNNPLYPDVLVVARTIQQCLGRFEKQLPDLEKRTSKRCREGRTIVAALKFFIDRNDHPSKDNIEALVDGKVADSWFFKSNDESEYFDFERLDRMGVDHCLADQD